ncbi:hypothetical protein [Kribbella deserti]|uniref:Uncharacterized protein n=1 Tax=Kribbella deserti TaxID=1926257 RepID=A0ABV6QWT1_9ACTN
MNAPDEVDDLLRRAGAQWRAGQPSPPEPDLARITGATRPGRDVRRWVPALAAASVAAIAIGALIVLPGRGGSAGPASQPPAATPNAGGTSDVSALTVRDGDLVEAQGKVIAAPGKPVIFCAPFAQTVIRNVPAANPVPTCPAGHRVVLTGLDVGKLTDVIQGVRFDSVRIIGTWLGGTIAVQQQLPVEPETSGPGDDPADAFLNQVPCERPDGGWKPGNHQIPATVSAYVSQRPDQLAELWIGWPEGTGSTPGSIAAGKPSVAVVEVVQGDVDQVRADLAKLFSGNLCVVPGRFSQTTSRTVQNQLAKLVGDPRMGISTAGSMMGNRPATVELTVVTNNVLAALSPIGLDKLDLRPAVRRIR